MTTAIVFDLDGTLVDSLSDIARAANQMLADQGRAPLPESTIRGFVGNGLPKLVERVMAHCDFDMTRQPELTQATLRHYNAAASAQTRPYPGVIAALESLQQSGATMGLCTNKPEVPARHILKDLALDRFFEVVIGGDTLDTRKPDPAHLHAAFQALGPHQAQVFVGDSEVDAETARRANIPFVLYSRGYRKSPLTQIQHQAAFDDFDHLPELILQMPRHSGRPQETAP